MLNISSGLQPFETSMSLKLARNRQTFGDRYYDVVLLYAGRFSDSSGGNSNAWRAWQLSIKVENILPWRDHQVYGQLNRGRHLARRFIARPPRLLPR